MDTNDLRYPICTVLSSGQSYIDAEKYKPMMRAAADEIDRLQAELASMTESRQGLYKIVMR